MKTSFQKVPPYAQRKGMSSLKRQLHREESEPTG
jgi:hypothetical protein